MGQVVTVCCGDFEVLLSDLYTFGAVFRNALAGGHRDSPDECTKHARQIMLSSAASLIERSHRYAHAPEIHFTSLLARFGDAECEDPRDGLFGFLGVADDMRSHRSEPIDYGREPLEIPLGCLRFLDGKFKTHTACPIDANRPRASLSLVPG